MPESSALNIPSSPVAALGTVILLVAFLVAAYGAAAGIVGNAQQRRRLVASSVQALYGLFALMMLASALIIYAFVTHDYSIKYVTQYSDASMPLAYKITAYWGGLDGSLMFWVSVLATFAAIAVRSNARRHADMIGFVVGVVMLVQIFFLALLIYNKNPFATWLTEAPPDGKGLNPLLQNYWMVIHPPSLYVGFVAATIPFAFGIAALASGRLDDSWLASVRSWSLVCWFFLSLGLILGGRWAYEELGWGGYWAWDPVENAGLLPWFTMTAFLHAIMIQQQRGMMKVWNLSLVVLTFFLTIFGTFMTRSGVVQSVHAFGEDNKLALLFILFMAAILILSFGLILHRLPKLRSSATFDSFVSREFAFLLNNWILLGCAFFVLFATMFPTLSQAVTGERITVGPPFFNKWMIPLGLTLLFLAGAAPLLAWRKSTRERLIGQFAFPTIAMTLTIAAIGIGFPRTRVMTQIFSEKISLPISLINFGLVAFVLASIAQEFWRGLQVRRQQTGGDPVTSLIGLVFAKRRKYGGYVVHLAVALLFFGFAGKAYETTEDRTVTKPGETFAARSLRPFTFDRDEGVTRAAGEAAIARDYTLRYDGVTEVDDDHKLAVTARLSLFEGDAVGEPVAVLVPARFQYKKLPDQPTTEVDIHSYSPVGTRIGEDVYLVLTGVEMAGKEVRAVNFRVYLNPLINWVWLGFAFLTLGTVICLVPQALIDRVSGAPRGRLGRLGEAAGMIAVLAGLSFGLVRVAAAQGPASTPQGAGHPGASTAPGPVRPAEHEDTSLGTSGGHMVAEGAAHLNRPGDERLVEPFRARALAAVEAAEPGLADGSPAQVAAVEARLAPIRALAQKTMAELVCLCGGCTRETVLDCKCGYAAEERGEVLTQLASFDLLDPAQRDRAYQAVLAEFQARYDGQRVLIVPKDEGFNRLGWAVPYLGLGGSLVLLYALGRRWVRRGKMRAAEQQAAKNQGEDQAYADLLDDELRDTD